MKNMKLTQTTGYLLLIDEEADLHTEPIGTVYLHKEDEYEVIETKTKDRILGFLLDGTKIYYKIIAYHPLTKEAKELDLPLLPKPFKTYRVGRRQKRAILDEKGVEIGVFKTGSEEQAQKYCDYLNSKQFSLEDMKKAFKAGVEFQSTFTHRDAPNLEEYIQSLSIQQLPKQFVPEIKEVSKYSFKGNSGVKYITFKGLEIGDILIAKDTEKGTGGDFLPFPMNLIEKDKEYKVKEISSFGFYGVPWIIDEDGNHHIPDFDNFTLKNKTGLKTITNSEGREEIIGIYKY